jgi:hypothetical protein
MSASLATISASSGAHAGMSVVRRVALIESFQAGGDEEKKLQEEAVVGDMNG